MKKNNDETAKGGGRRRLNNHRDLRRLLAATINDLEAGKIDKDSARVVGYLSSVLSMVLERGELADRLAVLEEKVLTEK